MPRPRKPKDQEPLLETDDRFPSGPWNGFWIQKGFPGRQHMRSLRLEFRAGKVTGSGSDRIGPFDFAGNYDLKTGKVTLTKRYAIHAVSYSGQNESDGKWLWGVWSVLLDRGGFHMWPAGEDDPTRPRARAEKETPVEDLVTATP